jgi:uncharacterized membrane protein YeaQ/YmgE (transglycosylase-associated protein family)
MNAAIWLLAGAAVAWAAFAMLGLNKGRGLLVTLIIGTIGGFFGGKVVAPAFTAASVPGDVSVPALMVAMAVAILFVTIANFVHNRWNV